MSITPIASRETTGKRTQTNHGSIDAELSKRLTTSCPRLGALSHHSFFSRHNPHPNRVRHIQGLNGRPVCTVRDDWFVTSSLYPHPLLKSHIFRQAADQSAAFPLARNLYGITDNKNKSALFSDAWKDELKDLTAKVSLCSQSQKEKKEEEQLVRRKTQYSAETGRLIPPSSKSYQRRSFSQRLMYPQPLYDQELMVLELLCQILQTDSLSTVQQWLLLAGQREKDLVMGMLKRALDGVDLSGPQQPLYGPSFEQSWRKQQRSSSQKVNRAFSVDKPERIGDAEVLEIHTETSSPSQEEALGPNSA